MGKHGGANGFQGVFGPREVFRGLGCMQQEIEEVRQILLRRRAEMGAEPSAAELLALDVELGLKFFQHFFSGIEWPVACQCSQAGILYIHTVFRHVLPHPKF